MNNPKMAKRASTLNAGPLALAWMEVELFILDFATATILLGT